MIKFHPTINISGEYFSPSKAILTCKLKFSDVIEPGDIRALGRYKGQSSPYGAATLFNSDGLIPLLLEFKDNHRKLLDCGASDIVLHICVAYKDQCNLEFSKAELKEIYESQIPMTISCWEEDENASI